MDQITKPTPPVRKRREDSPRSGLEENLPYRIDGLEKAKIEPGMSRADIQALDRVIDKLKQKLALQTAPKVREKEKEDV